MAGYTLQLPPITATLYTIQDEQTFKISGVKAEYPINFYLYTNSVYSSLLNSCHAEIFIF